MAQNDAALRPKQARAIRALLAEPTVTQAARVAGVGRRTLQRWLALPHFQKALAEAQSQERRLIAARLDGILSKALDVVALDMSAGAGAQYRLRAAGLTLRHVAGLQQYLELEARVEALEQKARAR